MQWLRPPAPPGRSVVLVSGPVQIPTPLGVDRIDVESAEEMLIAVQRSVADADIFHRRGRGVRLSLRRSGAPEDQEDQRDVDARARPRAGCARHRLANARSPPFLVGFAAETENVERNALAKLTGKNLDMIAANRWATVWRSTRTTTR